MSDHNEVKITTIGPDPARWSSVSVCHKRAD
jgi:hypothetical protein